MTDEERAAIRKEVDAGHMFHALQVKPLLDELERLQADAEFWHDAHACVDAERVKALGAARSATERSAAMREVVAAVAMGQLGAGCCSCGPTWHDDLQAWQHTSPCLGAKALALLGKDGKQA